MSNDTQAVLAYTAGIIDGEGSIYIGKTNGRYRRNDGRRAISYYLQVTVGINDPSVPDWLHGHFDGSRGERDTHGRAGTAHIYRWTVAANKAADLLKDLLPYLILKKEQARVAIEFQTIMRHRHTTPLDDAAEAVYEKYYLRLRELKRIRAAVETKPESTL